MVTLHDAMRVIAAAEKRSMKIGHPQNIAVVDADGDLVAHVRMDGAWVDHENLSIKKALTARAFEVTTIREFMRPTTSAPGSIPLRQDGKIVGAIGVSGDSSEQDQAVAEAGAAALTGIRTETHHRARRHKGGPNERSRV